MELSEIQEAINKIELEANEKATDVFMEFAKEKLIEWHSRNPKRSVSISCGMGCLVIHIDDTFLDYVQHKKFAFKELREVMEMAANLDSRYMDTYARDYKIEPNV